MEDKQLLELFWNRSEEAIPETINKYGQYCDYIAGHILQDTYKARWCVKESMQILWDTIPPRRPQNLKAYLCKITRNHALHMRYPELNERAADLFTAEIIVQEFLKGLEVEQRRLFVADYWYFASISEIAKQYKISENKVNQTLQSLRQCLNEQLNEKRVYLETEEEFLYVMTEIEDDYLVEAAPLMEEYNEKNKELIIAIEAVGGDYTSQMTTCYVYSQENGSLTQMIEPTPSEGNASVLHGLTFYGGRYATKSDINGEITIVDALEGTSISTGISCEDVESIRNDENDTYFIIHYKTGEIAIVEKNSGVMIKKTRFKANFSIASASYKDEKLYVQSRSDGVFVFVISEFE